MCLPEHLHIAGLTPSTQLEPDFFTSQHAHDASSNSILRLLHYPAIPPGSNISSNRAGSHSDYGSLTLLFQRSEGGEGLQILPSTEPVDSENWQDVGVVDGALLVNIGTSLTSSSYDVAYQSLPQAMLWNSGAGLN